MFVMKKRKKKETILIFLALFLIKSKGQREQQQQVLCTSWTFSSTHLVVFTSACRRGRRCDGTFIKCSMKYITMNPHRIMTTTHLLVPLHVWIRKASLGSKKQKQYDQYQPHAKSQTIHEFSLSSLISKAISVWNIYSHNRVRRGAKYEVCWVSLVGFIEVKKLASRWCHVRWGPIDGRTNWIINIYFFVGGLATALERLGPCPQH